MNPADPNVQRVEAVAAALGDLREDLVLVGGCAVGLLIDAPSAQPARVTFDVDLIAEVAGLPGYHALERRFEQHGFRHDVSAGAPICRWRIGEIMVDLMPTVESVLGFSNRWYPQAVASSMRVTLPSGTAINVISAAAFLATKFEAFRTRGGSDISMSHDLEDIINVIEGRLSIVDDVGAAAPDLRRYVASEVAALQATPDFANLLPGLVTNDSLHGERLTLVRRRIRAIAEMAVT